MNGEEERRARADALRDTEARRPTEKESTSEALLRRYLGASLYAALRRRKGDRGGERGSGDHRAP